MELLDGSANPRPSRPVTHRPRHRREGVVESRHAQLPGNSRELGGKKERFDLVMAPGDGVSEVQEHAGVALHGSADVAQQYERAGAHAARPSPEFHHIAARAEALGDRTSEIDPRASPSNPPPCPAFTRIPDETRQGRARRRYFVGSECGEVLIGDAAKVAPGLQASFWSGRVAFRPVGFRRGCPIVGRKNFLDRDRRGARLVVPRAASDFSLVVFAPEGRERPVEERNLFLAMDEQRTACVIHLVACAEVHMSKRLDEVEQTPGMDVDACAPQDAPKDEQVIEKTGHRPGHRARIGAAEP
jgi:hypothetical protein